MTWLRVICTKTVYLSKNTVALQGCSHEFIKYINRLSNKASTMPGFIKTDSYWKLGVPSTIVSESVWMSKDKWDDWYSSQVRDKINDDFNHIIKDESVEFLVKRKEATDVFLL